MARRRGAKRSRRRAAPESTARRALRLIAGAIAALGLLGAIGSWTVNRFAPEVEEKLRGGPPISATVRFDDDVYADGYAAVVPDVGRMASASAGVDGCDSLLDAARRSGAADISKTILSVLMEGRLQGQATIVGMRAKVLDRRSPPDGAHVGCASAGANEAIGIVFRLDDSDPTALKPPGTSAAPLDPSEASEPYFATGNTISLAKGEEVPLQITAVAADSYVEWAIELELVVDGEQRTMTLDDHGKPFRTTGPLGDDSAYAESYEWAWYEQPPQLRHE